MDIDRGQITKFYGSNWQRWKFQVTALLKAKDVFEHVGEILASRMIVRRKNGLNGRQKETKPWQSSRVQSPMIN